MGCHIYLHTKDGKEWKDTPWIRLSPDYYGRREDDPQKAFDLIQHLQVEQIGSLAYLKPYVAPKLPEVSCEDCGPAAPCANCLRDHLDDIESAAFSRREYERVQSTLRMNLTIIETFVTSGEFGHLQCD